MDIDIICVGNLKEKFLKDAADEYKKRLSKFCKLNIVELDESNPKKESMAILKACKGYRIAMCIEGNQLTSEAFAKKIEDISMISSHISFIVGSSEGLDISVKNDVNFRLSFSFMTFPHQLMRVILLEQIYRAFTINNNIKYHK